jgi:hypothetical protein
MESPRRGNRLGGVLVGSNSPAELAPIGQRMSANPHANRGLLLRELRLPVLDVRRRGPEARCRDRRVDARAGQVPADIMYIQPYGEDMPDTGWRWDLMGGAAAVPKGPLRAPRPKETTCDSAHRRR